MSTSERTRLVVRGASPTTKIQLSDARFRVLNRETAKLEARVEPGVYTLTFEDLGNVRLVDVIVPKDRDEVIVDAPELGVVGSVPIDDGPFRDLVVKVGESEPIVRLSSPIGYRALARLVVFVREAPPESSSGAFDHELALAPDRHLDEYRGIARALVGLKLVTGAGMLLDLESESVNHPRGVSTCNVALHDEWVGLSGPNHTMSVALVPGWRTSVFAVSRSGFDFSTVGISLSNDAFDPAHPARRLEAWVQELLRSNRRLDCAAALIAKHEMWVSELPMLGICLGHLAARDVYAHRDIIKLTDKLLGQLGPLPDVLALRLAVDPTFECMVAEPPMLAASWRAIVDASYRQPGVARLSSLCDRIAELAYDASPWLVWSQVRTQVEVRPAANALRTLVALYKADPPRVDLGHDGLALGVESALTDDTAVRLREQLSLPAIEQSWTEERLGRHLVVPLSTLRRTLDTLQDRYLQHLALRTSSLDVLERLAPIDPETAVALAESIHTIIRERDPNAARRYLVLAGDISREWLGETARARDLYERALDDYPTASTDQTAVGALNGLLQIHEMSRDDVQLVEVLARLESIRPSHEMATQVARLRVELGDFDGGIAAYKRVLTVADSPDREALGALLDLYGTTGRWTEQVETLEILASVGDIPERVERLSRAASVWDGRLGRPDRAADLYEAALALDPSGSTPLQALQDLYSRTGNYLGVAGLYRRAARLRERVGDLDGAIAAWDRVIDLSPDREAVGALASVYESTGRFDAAAETLRLYGEQGRFEPELLVRAAELWEDKLGDPLRAAATYETVLAIDPTNDRSLVALQRIYSNAGELDRAAFVALRTAHAREQVGNLDGAIAAYEDIVATSPQRAAYESLVKLASASSRWEVAVDALVGLARMEEEAAERADRLAQAAGIWVEQLGELSPAIALYEEAIESDPANASVLSRLASLYERVKLWGPLEQLLEAQLTRQVPGSVEHLAIAGRLAGVRFAISNRRDDDLGKIETVSDFIEAQKLPKPSAPTIRVAPHYSARAPQAAVVGSELVAFAPGVSEADREAIANAALLAQLIATEHVTTLDDNTVWYRKYFDVLSRMGLRLGNTKLRRYTPISDSFQAHEEILNVASALEDASSTLSLLGAMFNALRSDGSESRWLDVFERESRSGRSGRTARFQATVVHRAENGRASAIKIAFGLHSESRLPQMLFYKLPSSKLQLEMVATEISIDRDLLHAVRAALVEKVRHHAPTFIRLIPDL